MTGGRRALWGLAAVYGVLLLASHAARAFSPAAAPLAPGEHAVEVRAGRHEDAERILSFVVLHDHLDRRYQLAFGLVLQARRKHERALKPLGIAALMDLTDPVPVVALAECKLALGQRDEARDLLEAARGQLEVRPGQQPLLTRVCALLELMNTHRSAAALP